MSTVFIFLHKAGCKKRAREWLDFLSMKDLEDLINMDRPVVPSRSRKIYNRNDIVKKKDRNFLDGQTNPAGRR